MIKTREIPESEVDNAQAQNTTRNFQVIVFMDRNPVALLNFSLDVATKNITQNGDISKVPHLARNSLKDFVGSNLINIIKGFGPRVHGNYHSKGSFNIVSWVWREV